MSKKVKLLMLLLCVVSLLGCNKGSNGDNTNSSNGTVDETSETMAESLEAIVENLMPEDDMTEKVSVFVTSKDEMIGILASKFDKEYYKIDSRLREMVKEDLQEFNQMYQNEYKVKNALKQEGLGLLDEYAVLSLRFSNWNAYATYMDSDIYKDTNVTIATLKKNDTLEGNFVSFEGKEKEAKSILSETWWKKYTVVKVTGEMTVYLENPILYVSEGAEIVNEYAVKSSKDGMIIITK